MKKLNLLLALLTLGLIGFFNSCEQAEDLLGPEIQFFGGVYIDQDVTVAPGAVLRFSWLATKKSSNLKTFSIDRDGINLAGYPDEDIPTDNYKDSVSLEAPLNEGSYVYTFTVTDKKELTASESFTVTVEQTGGAISTWTKTLGSHQSATGSSFASSTGQVFLLADAKTNMAIVDFLYFYGSTNHATLAAPNDDDAATVFLGTSGLTTWTTKNATKFKTTTLSAAQFDGITDDLLIVSNANGASATKVNNLAAGNVVAFITDANKTGGSKMGLVKIVSITGLADGSMQIAVKVQQ